MPSAMQLPHNVQQMFFKTLVGDVSIREFECWVYDSKELEQGLPPDNYLDLISFDYNQPHAKYELVKIFESLTEKGEFETWKLKRLLKQCIERKNDYPNALVQFYDLYCKGYYFLDNLAFGYALPLDCPWSAFGVDSFEQLTSSQQMQLADSFYPDIEPELIKVNNWLDSKKIILTGNRDEDLGRFEFVDNRTEEEKKPTAYTSETTTEPPSTGSKRK